MSAVSEPPPMTHDLTRWVDTLRLRLAGWLSRVGTDR